MEIFIWKALATLKDRMEALVVPPCKGRLNRRQNKQDRRRSVNDGLIVTLSTREEKRKNPDRRHTPPELPRFHVEG